LHFILCSLQLVACVSRFAERFGAWLCVRVQISVSEKVSQQVEQHLRQKHGHPTTTLREELEAVEARAESEHDASVRRAIDEFVATYAYFPRNQLLRTNDGA
jgi:hypothetical protein